MSGLDILAAHMIGDYILQTNWIAARKLEDWRVRTLHVTLYCLPFFVLTGDWRFLVGVWLTHFITDSRRWASGKHWAPKPILVDQTIHIASLAILVRLCA